MLVNVSELMNQEVNNEDHLMNMHLLGVPVFLQQTLQRESSDQSGCWEFQRVLIS